MLKRRASLRCCEKRRGMPSTMTQQSDRRSRGNRRRRAGLAHRSAKANQAMPRAARGTASGRPFTVSVVPALEADGPLGEEDLAQFFFERHRQLFGEFFSARLA